MKKIVIFLVLIVLLAATMPVQAYWKEVQGELIHLSPAEQAYPANTPFFIAPGWIFDPSSVREPAAAQGLYDFRLFMDGTPVEAAFIYHWGWGNPPEEYFPGQKMANGTQWVFNFPEGLTDVHTFEGVWFVPCMALDGPQNCSQPNELVQDPITYKTTVTFTSQP